MYIKGGGNLKLIRNAQLSDQVIIDTINNTNEVLSKLVTVAPYVYELLGLRNISSFVGAAFAKELQESSERMLILNPHQDGYPDLLLMDDIGLQAMESIGENMGQKAPFSPFETGGIEIKTTCGDVPTAKILAKKGISKPEIGDQRIDLITKFSWKAHHRSTNNLLGIIWDFIDRVPTIIAICYNGELTENDWGKIVHPKEGGGRTTSVSIMTKSGIDKMLSNIIYILDDDRYINKIKGENR
jgi:hypothetical protein